MHLISRSLHPFVSLSLYPFLHPPYDPPFPAKRAGFLHPPSRGPGGGGIPPVNWFPDSFPDWFADSFLDSFPDSILDSHPDTFLEWFLKTFVKTLVHSSAQRFSTRQPRRPSRLRALTANETGLHYAGNGSRPFPGLDGNEISNVSPKSSRRAAGTPSCCLTTISGS